MTIHIFIYKTYFWVYAKLEDFVPKTWPCYSDKPTNSLKYNKECDCNKQTHKAMSV